MSIYTFAEKKHAMVDVFSSDEIINPWYGFDMLKDALKAKKFSSKNITQCKETLPKLHE
jgi:S-adenosylmethionine/arginine decarboxylase-like enzyme